MATRFSSYFSGGGGQTNPLVTQPTKNTGQTRFSSYFTPTPPVKPATTTPTNSFPTESIVTTPQKPPPTRFNFLDTVKNTLVGLREAANKKVEEKLGIQRNEPLAKPLAQALRKVPERIYPQVPEKYKSKGLYDEIVDFVGQLPGSVAQSYANSLDMLSTAQGRKELRKGVEQLPQTIADTKRAIAEKQFGKAMETFFSNPATSVALDVSDFIPGAALGTIGIKAGLKKSAKVLLKEVEEQSEKKVVKNVDQEASSVKSGGAGVSSLDDTNLPRNTTSIGETGKPSSLNARTTPSTTSTVYSEPSKRYTPGVTTVDDVLSDKSFITKYNDTISEKDFLQAIIGEVSDGREFKTGVKEINTAAGKIIRKLADKPNYTVNNLGDLIRGNIIADDAADAKVVLESLQAKLGDKVKEVEDYSANPNAWGYQGININIETPKGNTAEIQIQTPLSLKVQQALHPLYEKWRNEKEIPMSVFEESRRIADRVTATFQATPRPKRVASQDETSKSRAESAPKEAETQSKTDQNPDKSSFNRVYADETMRKQVIDEASKQTKDPPSVVKKVADTLSETKTKLVEYWQNEHERIRKLVDTKGAIVDDLSDPYLNATLYPGRVAEKINQGKKEAEVLIKDMKKVADEFKTDLATMRQQVNDYLYFRHAPERNAALGEKAAGVTDEEARVGLQAIENSPQGAKVRELAERAAKLNEQTLDLLKNADVISEDLYKTLREKYKHHVPLNRIFEGEEDIGGVMAGKGFDVRSTGIKSAKGSEREVDDILTNIITNFEQAVLRSEKNIVDQSTLYFIRNNQDLFGDLFTVTKPKPVGESFSGGVLREKTNDPTILQLFEDGKPVWIKINDQNLAIALRGVGREKLGTFLNAIGTFTRLYSGLATRFNPEFALPNKLRDLQETAVYLSSREGVGFSGATKTVARDLAQQNTKAVFDYLKGKDTAGARMYKELKEMGGTTGGFGLSTRGEVELSLKKLEQLANSRVKRIGSNLIDYIDNLNSIFEDSTRLSVYRQALAQGLSKERAAFLAKEASINFNRMGKGGPIVNALWMFSNASIQGSAKMLRALKNPKVLGATMLTVGGAVAAVNQWNDQVDPEWRDKVTKWDRLNGLPLVLPNPDGEGVKYITIPVSWGIKPIKVMADYAYDSLSGQGFDINKFANDTVGSMLNAYNPVGGTDWVSAAVPTPLDIPVEIARNQSWSGSKIKPDYDKNAPADVQYFSSIKDTKTGQAAISISEILQSKANILVSPADIKYAVEGYAGGIGRATSKTANTILGVLGGTPAPIDEYPILSRFYRERSEEEVGQGAGGSTEDVKGLLEKQSRDRFKVKEEAEKVSDELDTLSQEERVKRAEQVYNENPELYAKLKDIRADKKLGLTYTERQIKQLGVDNKERAKFILQKASEFKSKDERNNYLKDLYEKKILTDEVFEQMKELKAAQ